ncbi:MAG: MYG1 family protein [Nanoarchaeota archaeon]|nr:MYG1 family protein [Nanoarchaeota archaeon]
MEKIKILTHDKNFHADEVFAIAILKRIYSDVEIIRSREIKDFSAFDFVVDTGGEYDFEKKRFDHHQNGFEENRGDGVNYSSCGLIWKHYGREVVNSDKAFNSIDKNLIKFIDADDNGVTYSNGEVNIFSVADVIGAFNPGWKNEKTEDELFFEALEFASEILDREVVKANSILEGEKMVLECLNNAKEDFVVLPKAGLPKGLVLEAKNMKFYVFPTNEDSWVSVAVPIEDKSFIRRKYFPKSWAGLENEDLEKVSGVIGAKFCHKHLFIAVAKTREGIVEMTRKALVEE